MQTCFHKQTPFTSSLPLPPVDTCTHTHTHVCTHRFRETNWYWRRMNDLKKKKREWQWERERDREWDDKRDKSTENDTETHPSVLGSGMKVPSLKESGDCSLRVAGDPETMASCSRYAKEARDPSLSHLSKMLPLLLLHPLTIKGCGFRITKKKRERKREKEKETEPPPLLLSDGPRCCLGSGTSKAFFNLTEPSSAQVVIPQHNLSKTH